MIKQKVKKECKEEIRKIEMKKNGNTVNEGLKEPSRSRLACRITTKCISPWAVYIEERIA